MRFTINWSSLALAAKSPHQRAILGINELRKFRTPKCAVHLIYDFSHTTYPSVSWMHGAPLARARIVESSTLRQRSTILGDLRYVFGEIDRMEEYFTRLWDDLIGRIGGPMSFRLVLQPATALIFAIRDGLKDAREGRPAYFYSFFTDPENRRNRLREGFKAVSRVFTLAIVMDLIYQLIVLRWFYPLQSLIVAFVLAFLPYILLRGPVNRIARFLKRPPEASGRRLGRV
jgi:hypothetical protein